METIFNFFKKNYFIIFGSLIALLALFLHFFKLTQVPYGMHIDEVGLGYNSWCLANYGTDRYLNYFPIYTQNYMSGQSPLYTYLTALLVWLNHGNVSTLIVRLPGALMGIGSIYFGSKTVKTCLGKNATLLSALLFTIMPYGIMQSRFGLDCNAMFFCCILSLYTLINYIYNKKTYQLILCGMAFALTLYSYSLSYIVVAICLLFTFLYLLYTKEVSFSKLLIAGLTFLIASLPIILFVFVILTGSDGFTFLGLSILPASANRANELSLQNFGSNILQCIWGTLTNMRWIYNAFPSYGTIYWLSIVFFVFGIIASLKEFFLSLTTRKFHFSSLLLFLYVAELITAGLIDYPNINRLNGILVPIYLFVILGIWHIYSILKRYRTIFIALTSAMYLYLFLSFINYYFRVYPAEIFPQSFFQVSCQSSIDYVKSNLAYDNIHVDYDGCGEYYFFDNPVAPDVFLSQYAEYGKYGSFVFGIDCNSPVDFNSAYIVKSTNNEAMQFLCSQGIEPTIIPSDNYYYIICFEQ